MSASTAQRPANPATPASTAIPFRAERLRFADFSFVKSPSGQCSSVVQLEWDGIPHSGHADGPSSPLGELRVAAEAALRAIEEFTPGVHFDLLGIKHIRAFDANLLVVSIGRRDGDRLVRLVGCYLAETEVQRGAALAVLNATNRAFGNYVPAR